MKTAVNTHGPGRVELTAPVPPDCADLLNPGALAFLADLARTFTDRRNALLALRADRLQLRAEGVRPDFPAETAAIRKGRWKVADIPEDLRKRFVEITGPVDRKMVINALNSTADVFMADFEDSSSPTWSNMISGQLNLRDAVAGTITHEDAARKKSYSLNDETATLMVRPRGLHLDESHARIDGRPVPASLFDFGLFLFHNGRALIEEGSGPYFYLPKLESHLEARWWNDVFLFAQSALGIPRGTIRATVLIETLPAAFEMEEILYELREHSAGLNCGRWDYIFSFIKTLRHDPKAVLPDRSMVTMEQDCMRAYTRLVIRTCHRRGAHAIGGMAAQIPIKGNDAANRKALDRVRADKTREVDDGHDGTWVAHPGLVPLAREIFESRISGDHQIEKKLESLKVSPGDLLAVPEGLRTEEGLRLNVRVGIRYLAAWLEGNGCVPLYNLMEDAATAEISRAQVWQWIRHAARLDSGVPVTTGFLDTVLKEEMVAISREVGTDTFLDGRFREAAALFRELATSPELIEFLTLPAYPLLENGTRSDIKEAQS